MTAAPATRHTSSIAIIGLLFFIIGFFTWINGPLITFVKLAFDLDEVKAFFVVFVFYISYFVFALPASWALKRTGLKKGCLLYTSRCVSETAVEQGHVADGTA